MKKTPILLSTLALVTGVSGITNTLPLALPAYALEATDTNQVADIYVEDLYEMNQYFRIEELNFQKNRIVYEVRGNHALEGVRAQRTLIAMRDYESGVSEAEADEKSKSLGVGDSSWYKLLINDTSVGATNYTLVKDMDLKDNLSDILYFAVQFGELTTENGRKVLKNVYWVRGKIDYRKCIHSQLFDAEAMTCTVRIDDNVQTATLAAISDGDWLMFPEDERVITWEEEWSVALKEKIIELNNQLAHMNKQLLGVNGTLYQATTAIKNMQKAVDELGGTWELEQGLAQSQTLLQQVQKTYDWMIGAEQQKVMDNMQKNLNDALAEIERLKGQTPDGTEGDLQIQQELEKLQTEMRELQTKLLEANGQVNQEIEKTVVAKQKLAQIEIKMQEALTENEAMMREVQTLTNEKDVLGLENSKLKQENDKLLQGENIDSVEQNKTLKVQNETLKAQNQDLAKQNEVLVAQNQDLATQNEVLKMQNQDLVAQNGALETRNQDLAKQNEALNAKIKALEADLVKQPTCMVITEVRAENEPTETGIVTTDTSTMQDGTDASTEVEVVEVPDLGEVETKTNFWWIAVAIVGALGVLGVCCKKCLNRER